MKEEVAIIAGQDPDAGVQQDVNLRLEPGNGRIKKFLIVSTYAPPAVSGAPLMAYNLLQYFPKDSFAILTSHVGMDDGAIAGGQRLGAKYFFFDTPKLTTVPQAQNSFFFKCKQLIRRFGLLRSLFHLLSLLYLPFNIVRRGRTIIRDEKIEHLLGYSDHGPALLSVYLLHKLTGKPFNLHFYDLYYGNNFLWFFRAVARVLEPKLFQSATRISVMCEALGEHYQAQYGREVTVLHNAIPFDSSRQHTPATCHSEPYKVVFTGTIVWAQVNAVRNLVRAVEGISRPRVVLYLYTPHDKTFLESQGLYESDRVVFARGRPREMAAIQRSADILFTGLSFDTPYPLLINTSSPGKTCEYLISGRPILVHAPEESYIARYAERQGFACVVGKNSVDLLEQGIMRLLSDRPYVEQIVSNAWRTALLNHSARTVSNRFRETLQ
ncbi:MAG: hypothetical protein LAN71_01655 [Acidobacteriia bacterium]|nr:hypothetical protein [Terriglobia bacterium]